MNKAAVWMWMVWGASWGLIFHLQDFDLINRRIRLCKVLKLEVLLQTPKASFLGRRFTKWALQRGSWLWLDRMEGLVVLSWKWAKLCLFSPSVADSAHPGWENHSYLSRFFLSANNHLFVNERSAVQDKLMDFGFAKTGDWQRKEAAGEQVAMSNLLAQSPPLRLYTQLLHPETVCILKRILCSALREAS